MRNWQLYCQGWAPGKEESQISTSYIVVSFILSHCALENGSDVICICQIVLVIFYSKMVCYVKFEKMIKKYE